MPTTTFPLPPPPPAPPQPEKQLSLAEALSRVDENTVIKSRCQCKRVELSVPVRAILPLEFGDTYKAAVDCHCPSCRKYHVSAFATYLLAKHELVDISSTSGQPPTNHLTTFRDSCRQLGPVVRMQCSVCRSKLATRPLRVEERHGHQLLINMGAIDDRTLPEPIAKFFQNHRMEWNYHQRAAWTHALPKATEVAPTNAPMTFGQQVLAATHNNVPEFVTGSCTCGQSKYRIRFQSPTEQQHCYCRLCRRLSGGPFQTWLPFWADDFEWTGEEPPAVQQYVPHGRRHVCRNCGGVLTIVYRGQEDMIWPAAGSLDDDSLPGAASTSEFSQHLHSVMHISCRYKQSWYALPNDGQERIPEAG